MHWWQSAFSPPPSSPPSSADMNLLDTITGLDDQPKFSLFSFGARVFGFRSHQRRLTRSKRLQDNNQDVPSPHQLSRSPSGCTVAPQPLPLPELAVLLRQDAAHALPPSNSTANVRLPSPRINKDQAPAPSSKCRGGEEREKSSEAPRRDTHGNGDAVTSTAGFASKQACQDARRRTEHAETLASRRSPKRPYGAEKSPNYYMLNIPINVSTSSFSVSPLSPRRSTGDLFTAHHTSPQVFQVRSAPELAPSDTTLGLGHSYQMPYDTTAISVDNSPLHNPRLSFGHNATSPSGSVSPLHPRLSTDTPTARRESNAQTNVHPLPRPPAAAMPSQPAPSPKVTAKPERMKSQWKKGKLIGRGTFGSVYVGSNRETGALCAMKEVELLPDDPKSTECIRQLEQEINVLSQLKHPNIVQYYGSEIFGDRFYIYLEYVHPGSIVNYIRDHCGAITESVVRNFTRHILSGLAYLHSTKTIHRDIKGANLLVDAYGVVKLADFGMAKHLTEQAANLSLKGSPYWMAPELLQSVMQNDSNPDLALAVDIWSLGCTIIEMMNGKPPWSECEGPAAMFKVLRETPPIPETLSPEGKDFLRCCFQRNPAERPSASMLLEHRFMKNSQQPDFSYCNQALNGMKLLDKSHSQTERPAPIYKLDHVPVSTGAQKARGKVAYRPKDLAVKLPSGQWPPSFSSFHLDPLLIIPSSGLDQSIDHPSPSATVPSSMKQVVRSEVTTISFLRHGFALKAL